MPADYEKIYQEKHHALGAATQEFVVFFEQYEKQNADVLDLGCGQGRDALFIARLGHHVVGVDISKTGLAQLLADAQSENLNIEGIVADLRDYDPVGEFDVLLIDRTLHMLDVDAQLRVLERVCLCVRDAGFVLIADEESNLPRMRAYFEEDSKQWTIFKDKKGFLFVQKD
jgi:SAM-dependent methyltransferase